MSISGDICLFRRFITRLFLIDGKLSEEQVVISMYKIGLRGGTLTHSNTQTLETGGHVEE